jgi:indole-3-glycerol phosphate synthase
VFTGKQPKLQPKSYSKFANAIFVGLMSVDLATTERLAARLRSSSRPTSPLLVAESGIHTHADVERLAKCGAQAMPVGESLMKHADIGAKVRNLLGS